MDPGHDFNVELARRFLRCPNDGGVLQFMPTFDPDASRCEKCRRVFPIVDGISVLLTDVKRNAELEEASLEALLKRYSFQAWRPDIDRTLEIVRAVDWTAVWEWEDAAHWESRYRQRLPGGEAISSTGMLGNVRSLERWDAVTQALSGLVSPNIIDVGCGDGDTIPSISPALFSRSTYVGLDMSIHGLRLNRIRHKPARSLYVVGSADNPPLADSSFDVISFFGILHHAEGQEKTLRKYHSKVADGGRFLICEGLQRPGPLLVPIRRWAAKSSVSAHEHRLDSKRLDEEIRWLGGLKYDQYTYSVLYGGAMRLGLRKLIGHSNLQMHRWVMRADRTLTQIFGGILPPMRSSLRMSVVVPNPPAVGEGDPAD